MKYNPTTAVWEITFACNLNCRHCGSSCNTFLPDELTTEEALKVCKDIGTLKLSYLTLSGGEPLMRKDWDIIAKGLKDNGVIPNMISNGWLINQEVLDRARAAGISNIAISLDGTKATHDKIRKTGSFDKIMSALDLMKQNKFPASIITTVNTININELPEIYKLLVEKEIYNWQLQIIMPMGNALEHKDLYLEPQDITKIVDFAYEIMQEKKIRIDLADCIGYYDIKEVEIRNVGNTGQDYYWDGCGAGKQSFGIRCNGDVIGCTSIRNDSFIEDNVRNRSIVDIWNDEKAFAWNRNLTKKDLTGFCAKCQYGAYCLAGCAVTKIMHNSTLREFEFCLFRTAVEKERIEIEKIQDTELLLKSAQECLQEEDYQLAEIYYSKLLEKQPQNIDILCNLGFVHYQIENYELCKQFNLNVLDLEPNNVYAHKGLGLAQVKLGDLESGIKKMKRAIELAPDYYDTYYDLALVLYENAQFKEALELIETPRVKSKHLKEQSEELYQKLLKTEVNYL